MQYSIINCGHHSVHYSPLTYLFYSWNFVHFDPRHPPCPSPTPHLATTTDSLYLWAWFFFFFVFLIYHIWNEVVTQLCPTLCDPVDCSLPGCSVHGILQARILEWVAISFSRGSSQPRDQTWVCRIAGRRFTLWATREAHFLYVRSYSICPSLSNLFHLP